MKQLVAFVLAFLLMFTMCVPSFAAEYEVRTSNLSINADGLKATSGGGPDTLLDTAEIHYGINELDPTSFVRVESNEVKTGRSADLSFDFAGCSPNAIYSDMVEYIIADNSSATLQVKSCIWAPEYFKIEIGIYNWTTAENRYVECTGGSVNGNITFNNLTAGNYSVYIRNCGTYTLTSGYIRYKFL